LAFVSKAAVENRVAPTDIKRILSGPGSHPTLYLGSTAVSAAINAGLF
jgi:hypothetical protein